MSGGKKGQERNYAERSFLWNFLLGASRLRLFPRRSRAAREILARSDEESLQCDWLALGGDMRMAMREHERVKRHSK